MNVRFTKHIGRVMLAAGVCTLPFAALAKSSDAVPQVRAQHIRDFARLTFEWPQATLFTAKTSGNDVVITFDRAANPDMARLLKNMAPYVVKAQRKADGKTLVLSLDKPYRIRTFVSDNISGIDLLNVAKTKAVAGAKPAAPQAQIKPLLADKTPKKPEKKLAQLVDERLAELAPAAGEEAATAPIEDKKEEKPKPAPQAETPTAPAPTQETKPIEPAPAVPVAEAAPVAPAPVEITTPPAKEAVNPAVVQTEVVEEDNKPKVSSDISLRPMAVEAMPEDEMAKPQTEDMAVPIAEPAQAAPVNIEASQEDPSQVPTVSDDVKIVVSGDNEVATLRFPLKERTASAVFIRGNFLWVVFGKKLSIDDSDMKDIKNTIVHSVEKIENEKSTILRFRVDDNLRANILQQEGKTEIAINISAKKKELTNALQVIVNTEPPTPPHVFLPTLEIADPLEVIDPLIGDTLIVAPSFMLEEGVEQPRDFVEFSLLSSAQGVVVAKKADATQLLPLRNGLRISLPNGAYVRPVLEQSTSADTAEMMTASGTLFPYAQWKLEPNQFPAVAMQKLFLKTVNGANVGEKNLARLRLAQIYLSQGFTVEALGILDNINRTNRSYYRSAKLAAMRGAANFLMFRFADAARDFSAAELNDNVEATYWRAMLDELLGNQSRSYDFMAMNENFISQYPPLFRQRLAIVAADRAIAAKEYNTALKIFDTLKKDNIIQPIESYVAFLNAKIASENGQEKEAVEAWDKLAMDDKDLFVQARAELSRILWGMDNNTLEQDKVIDRLERLRLGWHGDGLELQVVQLLGDLYASKKDYVNAMRVWQIGVTGFKNTGPAIEMKDLMEDTFVKLFGEGIADTMSPLESLALFYEYRSFSPPGAAGIQMIEKLANRLVSVDLLSSAAQLLDQQMRTQLEKDERSRIGTKLAEIHLLNNSPKRALQVLQDSVYGENPILIRVKRNQLTAKATALLGKTEEALTILGQDDSVEAEKLRAMIYWRDKDWANITTTIENILKKRVDITAPLTEEEGFMVLRLALAYEFQNDKAQLKYMHDYFGPLMEGNSNLQAFNFITAPEITPTTRNFDAILAQLEKTRDFLGNYKAGLDVANAAESPATPTP